MITFFPLYVLNFTAGIGQKRKGARGTVKGVTVEAKRFKLATEKLSIEFSSTKGGPIGDNYRSFVDEVVRFTRKWTPLIGVQKWRQVKQKAKDNIITEMMVGYRVATAYDQLIICNIFFVDTLLLSHLNRQGGTLRRMMRRRLGFGR
jgi:hypothetical protein